MEILLVILGALLPQFATDIANGVGQFASKRWRDFVKEINSVIAKNNQLLSDWKTKSESQKAYAIQSIISSSGLGPRAARLRQDIKEIEDKDKKLTDEVTEKNIELTNKATKAEQEINNASTGVWGATQAAITGHNEADPASLDKYKVQDPSQNVDGGLQGGHN